MNERLSVIENKKILLVAVAHDDDPTYAGAIFKKATNAGHRVDLVVMEDGSLGSLGTSRRSSRRRREQELDDALNKLGISSVTYLGVPDGRLDEGKFRWKAKRGITRAIREYKPDVVITTSSNDYHMSHRAAAEVAEWGIFHASDFPLHIRERQFPWKTLPPTDKQIVLYEMEPQGLKTRTNTTENYPDASPGMLVVITEDELQAELTFYSRFSSQVENRAIEKLPYTDQRRKEAKARGRIMGTQNAEGLTQISFGGELTTTENIIATMFPQDVFDISYSLTSDVR